MTRIHTLLYRLTERNHIYSALQIAFSSENYECVEWNLARGIGGGREVLPADASTSSTSG